MAERPVFVPSESSPELVSEKYFSIVWHGGFAPAQKRKNVAELHAAAAHAGYSPLLEVSTRSEEKIGQHLSAFHLKVNVEGFGETKLECAFQGSKIFEGGGPYTDLYRMDAGEAKRDPRLRESGAIIGFEFNRHSFPLEPKTVFYDWLYLQAIYPHRQWLERLYRYAGFTDIEFNPSRSINCQARTCALFVSLMKLGLLDESMTSPRSFAELLSRFSYHPALREREIQATFS